MKQLKNQKTNTLKREVNNFLTGWHNDFILDYAAHREMNFIDMFIEYQEEVEIKRAQAKAKRKEEEDWLGKEALENAVQMSQSEIDEDYENLDFRNYK